MGMVCFYHIIYVLLQNYLYPCAKRIAIVSFRKTRFRGLK